MKEANRIHLKYVDDVTFAESIDLRSKLAPAEADRPQPDRPHIAGPPLSGLQAAIGDRKVCRRQPNEDQPQKDKIPAVQPSQEFRLHAKV